MDPKNLLLAALPADACGRLRPHMQIVHLASGEVLHRPGQAIRDVFFPIDCLISITVTMADARTTEAGIVGRREMAGVDAFMGGRTTNETEYVCQLAGAAVKIQAEPFLVEFDRVKEVRDVMLRFTQAYIAQLSQNVACNRLHSLPQRLARWLLECRERHQSDDLGVSHEFLGQMIGGGRPSLTAAIGKLEEMGLIEGGRNMRRVVDPAGLEAVSCECYGVLRDEYARLLEPRPRPDRDHVA